MYVGLDLDHRETGRDLAGACCGQRYAMTRHGVLERGEPVRVAAAFGQQAGALAHGVLIGRHVAGMLGMQRRDQSIEEAPHFLAEGLGRPIPRSRCTSWRRPRD